MMKVISRKPSSLASAKASMFSLLHFHLHHPTPTSPSISVVGENVANAASPIPPLSGLISGFGVRSFRSQSGRLDFRASAVSQAEYAFADYSYEEQSSKGGDEGLEIAKLGIAQEIVSALAKKGITKLFPIQRAVLEPAMQGLDMIGRAKTGTGKTLAFGIPIMDKVIQYNAKHGRGRNPLALVMAPTRELARQVEKEFYETAPNLDTICVYGGTPISRQMSSLDHGVDVVVGTPGRIIDLMKRGALNLSEVQFVVLDEADQMLAAGFEESVEMILDKLPQNRQSMMFSATMPSWIRNLTQKYLKNPLTIDLVGDSDQKLAEGISLYCIASEAYEKASIIVPLITEHANGGKCIVFTQTKRDADRLAYAMVRNIRCEALHGDISQVQRERTLSGFRDGRFNVLVATDVAARGLDIPNVDLVIHYELPNSSEIFVHRSGRTGRAGKKGTAILIYTEEQARNVQLIEREIGSKFSMLPRIAVEASNRDMLRDMGGFGSFGRSGGRFGGGFGGYSGSAFGRSEGYGESGSGRFGYFGGSGSGQFGGSSSSPSGAFGGSSYGQSGGFKDSSGSGGFGGSSYGRSGGFGDSSASGGFGGSSYGRSGGFGDSIGPSGFGGSSYGQSGGFKDSSDSGGFRGSSYGRSGDFGDSSSSSGIGGSSYGRLGGFRDSSGSNGFGGSSYGRSGGFGDSSGSGGFGGSSSGRSGGFGDSSGFGGFEGSSYGQSTSLRDSNGPCGFGGSSYGGSSGFGDSSSSQHSRSFETIGALNRSSSIENFGGSDRSRGIGNFGGSDQSSSFKTFGGSYQSSSFETFGGSDARSSGLGNFSGLDRSSGLGNFGGSNQSSGLGNFGGSDRSSSLGNLGGSDRSSGLGNFGGSDRSSSVRNLGGSDRSSGLGNFGGSDQSSGSWNFNGSDRSNSLGNSNGSDQSSDSWNFSGSDRSRSFDTFGASKALPNNTGVAFTDSFSSRFGGFVEDDGSDDDQSIGRRPF